MSFEYRKKELYAEDVPLSGIAASIGTPTYVYSRAALEGQYRALTEAFSGTPLLVCYSVKANSNTELLKLFAGLGSGFDIVSGGELYRVQHAKAEASKVVFAGVAKSSDEMAAALAAKIALFNVESEEELLALDRAGRRLGVRAPFAIRVNPDVDAKTHRYIATGLKTSKFGVPFAEAVALYEKSKKLKGLQALGLDCHIGSQLTDLAPISEAVGKVADLYRLLLGKGHALRYLDLGGGLGISYRGEKPPSVRAYAKLVKGALAGTGATLVLEPGRFLTGNAGVLLTRVLYRKKTAAKQFVFVDAGMNDLLRPALYEAHHELRPCRQRPGRAVTLDVAGPVCESSDVLARDRKLPLPEAGDLWAVMSAGAYGMSMASSYNSRPRPAEVLVDGDAFRVIRARESYADLVRGEG